MLIKYIKNKIGDFLEFNSENAKDYKQEYIKQLQIMQQLESIIRIILTPEAKERLSNIKLVNQELYFKVAQFLFQMYQAGQINNKIDDFQLKSILSRVQPKKEIKIVRK